MTQWDRSQESSAWQYALMQSHCQHELFNLTWKSVLLCQVISSLQAAEKYFGLKPAYIFRISGNLENWSSLVFKETTKTEPEGQGSSAPECTQLPLGLVKPQLSSRLVWPQSQQGTREGPRFLFESHSSHQRLVTLLALLPSSCCLV